MVDVNLGAGGQHPGTEGDQHVSGERREHGEPRTLEGPAVDDHVGARQIARRHAVQHDDLPSGVHREEGPRAHRVLGPRGRQGPVRVVVTEVAGLRPETVGVGRVELRHVAGDEREPSTGQGRTSSSVLQ
jgi:hypothetical protein